jgi:hypothetical protein
MSLQYKIKIYAAAHESNNDILMKNANLLQFTQHLCSYLFTKLKNTKACKILNNLFDFVECLIEICEISPSFAKNPYNYFDFDFDQNPKLYDFSKNKFNIFENNFSQNNIYPIVSLIAVRNILEHIGETKETMIPVYVDDIQHDSVNLITIALNALGNLNNDSCMENARKMFINVR